MLCNRSIAECRTHRGSLNKLSSHGHLPFSCTFKPRVSLLSCTQGIFAVFTLRCLYCLVPKMSLLSCAQGIFTVLCPGCPYCLVPQVSLLSCAHGVCPYCLVSQVSLLSYGHGVCTVLCPARSCPTHTFSFRNHALQHFSFSVTSMSGQSVSVSRT